VVELKTTSEERAAARAQSSGMPGSGSELAARLAADIDTLLAERDQLQAHVKALLGLDWRHQQCRGTLGVLRGAHFNTKECNCKPGGIRKAAWAALETK